MCQPKQECIFYPARSEKSLSSVGAVQSSTALPVELAGDGTGSRSKGKGSGKYFGHDDNQNCPHLSDLPSSWGALTSSAIASLAYFGNVKIKFPNDP